MHIVKSMLDKSERLDLKSKILNTIKILSKKLLRALIKQKELHFSNGLMKVCPILN